MDTLDQIDHAASSPSSPGPSSQPAKAVLAPLAGNVFQVPISHGQIVAEGDVVIVLEAMKMETEIRASCSGAVAEIHVREGDAVAAGDPLATLA